MPLVIREVSFTQRKSVTTKSEFPEVLPRNSSAHDSQETDSAHEMVKQQQIKQVIIKKPEHRGSCTELRVILMITPLCYFSERTFNFS